MSKRTITVICRDKANIGYEEILIYTVEADPRDEESVLDAVIEAREDDLGEMDEDDKAEISVLFAFEGDVNTIADWRM
jgi:transcriptional/translational regulatory protein YebC/TACO1